MKDELKLKVCKPAAPTDLETQVHYVKEPIY